MKDETLYLEHILEYINKIDTYVKAGKSSFEQVTLIQDGVIRILEIIGEATKRKIPNYSLESNCWIPRYSSS